MSTCPSCLVQTTKFYVLDPPKWICPSCARTWIEEEDVARVRLEGPRPYGSSPGAAVTQKHLLMAERAAVSSPDGKRQYFFNCFTGEKSRNGVLFILRNPLEADTGENTPEQEKCLALARHWGAGFLRICYLFSWITPDVIPSVSSSVDYVGGAFNEEAIKLGARYSDFTVCAWGFLTPGNWKRAESVVGYLREMGVDLKSFGLLLGQPRGPTRFLGSSPTPF